MYYNIKKSLYFSAGYLIYILFIGRYFVVGFINNMIKFYGFIGIRIS